MSNGTGTRKSIEKLRNIALNLAIVHHKKVILDFKDVKFLSSSFADELIGKIIKEKGSIFFTQAFVLKNLNPNIIGLIKGR